MSEINWDQVGGLVAILLAFGAVASAIMVINKLIQSIRQKGAEDRQVLEAIKSLQKESKERLDSTKLLHSKVDLLRSEINEFKILRTKENADFDKRITIIENTLKIRKD